jgi:hypothetical protein
MATAAWPANVFSRCAFALVQHFQHADDIAAADQRHGDHAAGDERPFAQFTGPSRVSRHIGHDDWIGRRCHFAHQAFARRHPHPDDAVAGTAHRHAEDQVAGAIVGGQQQRPGLGREDVGRRVGNQFQQPFQVYFRGHELAADVVQHGKLARAAFRLAEQAGTLQRRCGQRSNIVEDAKLLVGVLFAGFGGACGHRAQAHAAGIQRHAHPGAQIGRLVHHIQRALRGLTGIVRHTHRLAGADHIAVQVAPHRPA